MDSNTIRYSASHLDLNRNDMLLTFCGGRTYIRFDIYHLRNTFWNRVTKSFQRIISLFCNCKKFLAIQDRSIALFSQCVMDRFCVWYMILEQLVKNIVVVIISNDTLVCRNELGLYYRLFQENLSNWSACGLYFNILDFQKCWNVQQIQPGSGSKTLQAIFLYLCW